MRKIDLYFAKNIVYLIEINQLSVSTLNEVMNELQNNAET
jgi:hypothetical protein